MSTNLIKLYYGPCESFYTLCHKPQKLAGLRDRLRKMGYRVEIKPIDEINCLIIAICGHEVFRCNVNFLGFNMIYERDPVCIRAVNAVLYADAAFNRARVYLWTWTMLSDQMFKRTDHAPKDHWPFEIKVEPFSLDCVNCCGILLAKKTEEELEEEKKQKANTIKLLKY